MSRHTSLSTPEPDASSDLPFGTFSPSESVARMIARTRSFGTSWLQRRLAFGFRRFAISKLAGKPVDIEALGARMRLYAEGNVCEKRMLFTPQYFDTVELELLGSRICDGFTFIDVGANVGAYSLFVAARAGKGARILAIEPQPDIFARLTANISFNPFGSIKAVACAVADKPGELTLFLDPVNKGESSVRLMRSSAATALKVPATTLLALVQGEGYQRLDAIKLDVEGAEDLILEPYMREAPEALWPKLVVIEDSASRWQTDLEALLLGKGYALLARTRLNLVFELKSS
ncbi:MAG: FkbM family methyltransferase [Bosea sp. (in: a-proteobacteria)]